MQLEHGRPRGIRPVARSRSRTPTILVRTSVVPVRTGAVLTRNTHVATTCQRRAPPARNAACARRRRAPIQTNRSAAVCRLVRDEGAGLRASTAPYNRAHACARSSLARRALRLAPHPEHQRRCRACRRRARRGRVAVRLRQEGRRRVRARRDGRPVTASRGRAPGFRRLRPRPHHPALRPFRRAAIGGRVPLAVARLRTRGARRLDLRPRLGGRQGQLLPPAQGRRDACRRAFAFVNVRVASDGEEETGGHSIVDFIAADERGADACLIFDSVMPKDGLPAFDVGTRGLVYYHVRLRSGERDLHSGLFGGAALNAVHALAQVLAPVVAVPDELRAGAVAPTQEELAAWEQLEPGQAVLARDGARPLDARAAEELYLRTFAGPAVDVNGIHGGEPDLQKTVLPVEAHANVSIRLAPDEEEAAGGGRRRARRWSAGGLAGGGGRSSSLAAAPPLVAGGAAAAASPPPLSPPGRRRLSPPGWLLFSWPGGQPALPSSSASFRYCSTLEFSNQCAGSRQRLGRSRGEVMWRRRRTEYVGVASADRFGPPFPGDPPFLVRELYRLVCRRAGVGRPHRRDGGSRCTRQELWLPRIWFLLR